MLVCAPTSSRSLAASAAAVASSSSLASSASSFVALSSSAVAHYLDGLSGPSELASPSTSSVTAPLAREHPPRLPLTATTTTTAGMPTSSGPTTPQLVHNHKHKHILLMLDMQRFMLEDEPVGVPAAKTVYPKLKEVLEFARSAEPNPPLIIHVRNTGDPGEPDEPGTPGWQLIFDPLPGEIVVDKRKNNAFAGTSLGSWVPTDAEIVVVGFQTDFSVRATCSAALDRGNEVILIREAHATFNRIEVLNGGGVTKAAAIEAEVQEELGEAGVHVLGMEDLSGIFLDR